VEFHEFGDIELRLLENLALADVHVLDREDALALLLDLLANGFRNELLDEVTESSAVRLSLHNVTHLLLDLLVLGGVAVRGGLDLVNLAGGERDAEHADGVTVSSLDLGVGLDGGLPLLDQRAQLVAGHGHAVEIGKAVAALNILDHQRDLTVSLIVIVVQIGEIDFDDSVKKTVGSDLGTLGTGDQSFTALTLTEVGRGLDVVPFLEEERVSLLLLAAFLSAFRKALVLSNSHV